tara:strand:+ start:3464 stop:4339 length:876 start_codon:yes stop_codon:yes gene_type:complete
MLLLAVGLVYGADESAVNSHSFYGTVLVGEANAANGATICVDGSGDDCISVSPAGEYGGAAANADKLVAICETGDTISFTITGTGCSGTSTLTQTCDPVSVTELALDFGGTCGTSDSTSSGGGGGGGGGSGGGFASPSVGSVTDISDDAGFQSGEATAVTLTQGDSTTIVVDDTTYSITLATLTDEFVVIEYNGDFITLQPGETSRIDLDGDGVADVSVKLSSIEGGEASLEFTKLQELKPRADDDGSAEGTEKDGAKVSGERGPVTGVIVVIAIVLLGLVGYFIYLRRPK